jgi:hypothetical protein
MGRTARKPAGRLGRCPEVVPRGPALRGLRSCAGSGPGRAPASTGLALRGPGYGWSARRSPVRKLWMARWKRACRGGQRGRRCGHFVDKERILKLVPGNPCATGVPGSRNTSLPETGTTPGATPERRKNRETGTSRGYPVPAAGRLTKSPPGNQRASGQRPGQAPASHTCRGLAYFPARPFPRSGPFPAWPIPADGPGLFPGPSYSNHTGRAPAEYARQPRHVVSKRAT